MIPVTLYANTNYLSISGQEITGGTVPGDKRWNWCYHGSGSKNCSGVDPSGTDNSTDVTLAGSDLI